MKVGNIEVANEKIQAFCRKWNLKEFSLFGSVLGPDFQDDSDVDVLVSFLPGHAMTFEGFLDMRDELTEVFGGREVDLVEKRLVTNPFRRFNILTNRKILYAA